MSDEFELSDSQRGKLLRFAEQFNKIHGDADFDCRTEWSTPELLALALRGGEILGFEGKSLEQFFAEEFGVAGSAVPRELEIEIPSTLRSGIEPEHS